MLYHCYRNRCTIVTENDASLLLILMYSILPKMMYFSLPITDERHDYSPLQLGEPVVRHRSRKQMSHMHKDIPDIEMFQTFVPAEVEQYHNGNDFRI